METIKSPVKAIRRFCLQCMGYDPINFKDPPKPYEEVNNCLSKICPLLPFRFGKNPFIKREASKASIEALKEYHKTKLTDTKTA